MTRSNFLLLSIIFVCIFIVSAYLLSNKFLVSTVYNISGLLSENNYDLHRLENLQYTVYMSGFICMARVLPSAPGAIVFVSTWFYFLVCRWRYYLWSLPGGIFYGVSLARYFLSLYYRRDYSWSLLSRTYLVSTV